MRRHAFVILVVLLTTILVTLPVSAQKCTKDDTVLKCWERFNPPKTEEAAQEAGATAQADTAAANTGVPTLTSPAGSALQDFLTMLGTTLESSSFESDSQAFTFDWNPKTKILGVDPPFKFQAVFRDPSLSAKVTELLATNETAATELDNSLEPTDDVELSATIDRNSKRFGRSIESHRDLFETWYLELISLDQQIIATLPAEEKPAVRLQQIIKTVGITTEGDLFSSLPAERQSEAIAAVEAAARAFQSRNGRLAAFAEAFTKLLNNQSQIYVSGIYNARRN
ncbi:MAG TPA: hypothetical protein VMU84_20345, partial [Thermoanaerobaculia bacterium]|nr:hypothetical protein [Thermoanaerobaculia bacterium]